MREGLLVLDNRMEAMDPDENKIYKFLEVEQADGTNTKAVFERVKSKVEKRVKMLVNTELNDTNLISAINLKVVSVAAYSMNVFKFIKGKLKQLEQIVKRELRSNQILGKQASYKRLYLKREDRGRGLKSMWDLYKETRLWVAHYMSKSENRWIVEKRNIESTKCCCERRKNNNRRSRHEIEVWWQRDTTRWWVDQTGVETDIVKGKNRASKWH